MTVSPRPTRPGRPPGYPRAGDTDVPAQPNFPALERDVLEHWRAHDTFRASVRQRPQDREFVFYDGPPFANGLPHYGHLLTGYVKDLVPSSAGSAGTATACPPRSRRNGCWASPARPRSWPWVSRSSTRPAGSRCCATPETGRTTSPARRAGSTSSTTTRRWTCPTWRASCGRSSSCGTRAWSTRGSRCCPTAGGARPRCPTTSCGWTTTPTPNGRTPRSRSGSSWRPGSGCWPGPPRRGRCRPTWPARSARTSATWCWPRTASGTSWPGTGRRPTSASSRAPPRPARSWPGGGTSRCFPTWRTRTTRSGSSCPTT